MPPLTSADVDPVTDPMRTLFSDALTPVGTTSAAGQAAALVGLGSVVVTALAVVVSVVVTVGAFLVVAAPFLAFVIASHVE
jgi:hypothetical protein